jgi:2-aminoadipate transaminase
VGEILFSSDAEALAPSPIRRFASLLNDPDVISFAGGVPNPETFPAEALALAAAEAVRGHGPVSLQYGPTAGLPALRERIAGMLSAAGIPAEAGGVFLTTGSQQALALLSQVLLDPGDVVATEEPAYVGALAAFRSRRPKLLAIARDAGRIDVSRLTSQVEAVRRGGGRVKFLYTVPNFQNPSGWTLSAEARGELLEAASRLDLLILEDDPYGEVYFGLPPPRSLAAMDTGGRVVYLGTFSKTLAAGLRCGFLIGPAALLAKVELAKQSADLCSSSLDQFTIELYFRHNDFAAHLTRVRAFYAAQKQVLLAAIRRYFPSCVDVSDPAGGLFCWARLPEGADASRLLETVLEKERVAFIPGASFFLRDDAEARRHFRLTFAKETPGRLEEGAKRLGGFLREERF